MKATHVRDLSSGAPLFICEPPMRFLHQEPGQPHCEVREFSLVVGWAGEVVEGIHRAVLHSAIDLGDEKGVMYDAGGTRIFDCDMTVDDALVACGYVVVRKN